MLASPTARAARESDVTRLSVIIISHGHQAMLPGCLASLMPALAPIDHEILLWDNLPAGAVERELRPAFPTLRYQTNSSPVGLSENMNRAAEHAVGEFLLFLNPDTAYVGGDVAQTVAWLDEREDVGVLGCRLLNEDGSVQQSHRRFPTLPVILSRGMGADRWPRKPAFYRWRMMLDEQPERPTEVDWVFGAFLLIRARHFRTVGGMDCDFRLYYEDVDLCYRLRRSNLRAVIYPELTFAHHHMRTSAARPLGRNWRWHLASAIRFLRKHRYAWRPSVGDQAG
jgi:GT2 family glycosyltransferase